MSHNQNSHIITAFNKAGFWNADVCVSSRCDSPEKLKATLPRLEQELKDTGKFKDFYQFTFNFAKNPGQKGLGEPKNDTFMTSEPRGKYKLAMCDEHS